MLAGRLPTMIDGKRVLVVVPARGGSKGIPLKNLAKVCGETLIAHVGKIVKQLEFVDGAVVSTDHPDIMKEAVICGLGVVGRPPELSGDLIGDLAVLNHALWREEYGGAVQYDVVVMLQPTCPMRTVKHVTQTVEKLVTENLDSVWTVSPVPLKYHALKQLSYGIWLDYFRPQGREIVARQQLSQTYYRNGACYAFTRECLLVQQTIMGKKSAAVVIDEPLVSIDTPGDLAEAERLMRARVD